MIITLYPYTYLAPLSLSNLTVTLMGVPKVEVSVVPMSKHLPNVLDLPLISGFVQSAIAAAANEYVAPKSMTLNLAQIIMGDGVKKDTVAVGILMVKVHHATGLGAQDRGGSSDPYVVLAYTKLGKPLYSSRIILGDLNPVFEETAFLIVTADEVNSGEDLSVQLWDSDKRSADDLVGRVVVSLKELMKKPNTLSDREDHLSGFEDADSMPGTVSWSVGYYDKVRFFLSPSVNARQRMLMNAILGSPKQGDPEQGRGCYRRRGRPSERQEGGTEAHCDHCRFER